MSFTKEIFTSSIVAVGDFNPVIFTPDWLERNNLIGDGDAMEARDGNQGRKLLISHQITTFATEWFVIQVLENQFSLTSKGVLTPAFKDLATAIFQLLPQTPVKAVGLNFNGHFKFSDAKEYHSVGDVLAPKDIWSKLYPDLTVGMEQLTILFQQGTRENPAENKDEKRVTVKPSGNFKHGISLLLNDHYEVRSESEVLPAVQVARHIEEQWDYKWTESESMFTQILDEASKGNFQ